MVFACFSNPFWNSNKDYCTTDDDDPKPEMDEDPIFPTIHLTKEQKHCFREPWKNALIAKCLLRVLDS